MATGSEEIRVPIGIPVETNAGDAAESVDQLREALAASKDKIRDARDALKNLRGSSDEVKAAKDQLKAVLDKENASVAAATLALVKQGTTYGEVTAKARQAAAAEEAVRASQEKAAKAAHDAAAEAKRLAKVREEATKKAKPELEAKLAMLKERQAAKTKAMGSAVKAAGGPVASLTDRIRSLGEVAGGEGAGGMGLASLAAAGLAAAVVAVTAAVVAGIAAFAKLVFRTADAERSLALVREAATGSAEQAKALGSQVDALGDKVVTSKAALNELAVSMRKGGLGGQTLVDTFNAVGQASAAMGDEAGAKLRELVDRGKVSGRMFANALELQGTGVSFDDIAKELASSTKGGVQGARKALAEGRVPLGDGAAALRRAVEKKFGDVNLRKMLSFDGLVETMKKKFSTLTKGVDLDRLLVPLGKFVGMLDEGTMTGHALKRVITAFGNGLISVFEKGAPLAEGFLKGLIIGGLQVYITYLKVRNALKAAFGSPDLIKNFDAVGAGIKVAKAAIVAFGLAVAAVGGVLAVALAPFVYVGKQIGDLFAGVMDLASILANIDWKGAAGRLIDGLISGITGGAGRVVEAVKNLAGKISGAFTGKMEIKSPSRLFARHGKQLPAGVAAGVEDGADEAQSAVEAMVAVPSGGGRGGAAGGAVNITATLVIQGGGGNASATLDEPELLAKLTKLLADAAAAAGIGVPA